MIYTCSHVKDKISYSLNKQSTTPNTIAICDAKRYTKNKTTSNLTANITVTLLVSMSHNKLCYILSN